ncbi:MAG: alpha/beta fold hydrolase, partial [Myxococcales bacterium]
MGIHGEGWRPQTEALAGRHRCLWFDNRGCGRSQPLTAPLSIAQMADDARAVLDAAGVADAHMVGHSMGGLIALELALTHRARVRSLSLLCTFARGSDGTALTAELLAKGLRTRLGTRRMRRQAFLEIVMPPSYLAGRDRDALAAELAPLFGRDLADSPAYVMKQLGAMRAHDVRARLHELAGVPTLVVSASHDPIARPASARALAAGIPGARHEVFPDASHGVVLQCPERVNALLA